MPAPDWVYQLPTINAGLNSLATLLLLVGYGLIRSGQPDRHKQAMLLAFTTSIAFLICYLAYHFALHHYTGEAGQKFQGTGAIRPVYFTILITHVLLAAAVPFLAIATIRLGLKEKWERHKKIARIPFPIWLYVSVTGVIIYLMLYHWPVATE